MKNRIFILVLILALCLVACQTEPPTVSTDPTTVPTVETTVPPETTVPEETTVPPETTVPEETTEPVVLEFPEGEVQAALLCFADMLYVREDEVVDVLPEGYVYVGQMFQGNNTKVPTASSASCHIPSKTEFYASPTDPDHVFFAQDGQYRRMIRAALVENTWSDTPVSEAVPENYTQLFFENLLANGSNENYYNYAAALNFSSGKSVDLNHLFYSGFDALDQREIPLTEEEIAFLEKNGFGSEKPLGNAKRIPEAAMDAALQRFFGLGLADTYGAGLWQIGVYHKESKCYYAWRSGSNYTFVNVDQVDYNAETGHCVLMITCDIGYKITSKMTLKMEEDVFRILSNVTVSTEKPF